LSKTDKQGITQDAHLKQVERQLGRKPAELEEPNKFPTAISYIWTAFTRLSNRRNSGMNGAEAITFDQIKAWKELTQSNFRPWEIEALLKLDEVYLNVARKK
tara:strand:+ start:676 stop:981 length:306 start_codon:yes stop_codon:yes gene_type:complete